MRKQQKGKKMEKEYGKWAKFLIRLFFAVRVGRTGVRRWLFERMWKKVWLEEGYATPENISQILARHEKKRKEAIDLIITFLALPVGTVRLIPHYQSEKIVLEEFFTIEKCWQENDKVVEVTLLTSNKKFRKMIGGLVFIAILRIIYQYTKKLGGTIIIGAIDSRVYRLLRIMGLPFKMLGKPVEFEGSKVVPSLMSIPEAERIVPVDAPIRKLIEN